MERLTTITKCSYRCMELTDYENIIKLWQESEGLKLREADSRKGINTYLSRNPRLSFVAEYEGKVIGTIMAGHDGKRGYIQHLAVNSKFRGLGIGGSLLKLSISELKSNGIIKSHIHVLTNNDIANTFWSNHGWVKRTDIDVYSYINGSNANT